MHIFMPMLKERFIQLLSDHSTDSVLIQKQIFKILYALFQVFFGLLSKIIVCLFLILLL